MAGPGHPRAWLLAAGLALGLSACVRGVSIPLPVLFAVWAAFALGGAALIRFRNAALVGGAALVVLFGYAALNYTESDQFALGETSGWAIYSRTAPFADCERFTPPAGTERLCETTSERSRPGPDFYGWEAESPARILYGGSRPATSSSARSAGGRSSPSPSTTWRRSATTPCVSSSRTRRSCPDWFENRTLSGLGYEITDIDARAPEFEQQVLEYTRTFYPSTSLSVTSAIDHAGRAPGHDPCPSRRCSSPR